MAILLMMGFSALSIVCCVVLTSNMRVTNSKLRTETAEQEKTGVLYLLSVSRQLASSGVFVLPDVEH